MSRFKSHISDMFKKESRQLNVLQIFYKYLNRLSELKVYHSVFPFNFPPPLPPLNHGKFAVKATPNKNTLI
jgi:hypothetical protein